MAGCAGGVLRLVQCGGLVWRVVVGYQLVCVVCCVVFAAVRWVGVVGGTANVVSVRLHAL